MITVVVTVVVDSTEQEEVVEDVESSRCVIFINRNSVKNSPVYRKCRTIVSRFKIPYRVITLQKSMTKKELEELSVWIAKFYCSSPKEKIIFAFDRLVVY